MLVNTSGIDRAMLDENYSYLHCVGALLDANDYH